MRLNKNSCRDRGGNPSDRRCCESQSLLPSHSPRVRKWLELRTRRSDRNMIRPTCASHRKTLADLSPVFGPHSAAPPPTGVATVTPTPSSTIRRLVLTPVGSVSVFGFTMPVPWQVREGFDAIAWRFHSAACSHAAGHTKKSHSWHVPVLGEFGLWELGRDCFAF
jgi:hypothetical protein